MNITTSNLTIFGKELPLYGLFFYFGIAVAVSVAFFLCKKKNIDSFDLVCSAVYTMIGAILGAKLLFIAVSLPTIIEHNIPIINVIKGGFVFYGGLIGGILGLFIYTKQFKLPTIDFFTLYAPVVPLGHAFGRVGCFFAGCCYGMEYDGPLHCIYHDTLGTTPLQTPLLPIQLIEAVLLVLIFAVLIILYCKNSPNVIATYMLLYGIVRFTLEFFRGDRERGLYFSVSTSQWISIGLIVAGLLLIFLPKFKKAKQKNQP